MIKNYFENADYSVLGLSFQSCSPSIYPLIWHKIVSKINKEKERHFGEKRPTFGRFCPLFAFFLVRVLAVKDSSRALEGQSKNLATSPVTPQHFLSRIYSSRCAFEYLIIYVTSNHEPSSETTGCEPSSSTPCFSAWQNMDFFTDDKLLAKILKTRNMS